MARRHLGLGVGLSLGAVLAIVARRNAVCRARRIDVMALAISASIITWLLVTNPLISEYGQGATLAIAGTAYLPISIVLLDLLGRRAVGGLARNRSMQLVVAAAVANVVATMIGYLRLIEVAPADTIPFRSGSR